MENRNDKWRPAGLLGAGWGIAGLTLMLFSALWRLCPYASELQGTMLEWHHWALLGASLVFMGYAEGYRGFQKRFSPRFAARALYLSKNPSFLRVLLAPLFCMGFFHATRRRKITTYALTTMIVLLIVLVRSLPQPWRGIVDAGVLLGLGWGLVTVWWYSLRVFCGIAEPVSPETPE